jgi:hypothetical protein
MYSKYPFIKSPSNESSKIWRYMDFTKFLSLLETQSLFFTRADKFEDPFEGILSTPSHNLELSSLINSGGDMMNSELYGNGIRRMINEGEETLRKWVFVNCWHLNDNESAAMWDLYSRRDTGIAIQTTFKNLYDCLDKKDKEIFIGLVNYIDYEKDLNTSEGNILSQFMHKRNSFSHEKELRALFMYPWSKDWPDRLDLEESSGLSISIDFEVLIDKIYISPFSPIWIKELVQSIVKKYNLDRDVVQSSIYNKIIR